MTDSMAIEHADKAMDAIHDAIRHVSRVQLHSGLGRDPERNNLARQIVRELMDIEARMKALTLHDMAATS